MLHQATQRTEEEATGHGDGDRDTHRQYGELTTGVGHLKGPLFTTREAEYQDLGENVNKVCFPSLKSK